MKFGLTDSTFKSIQKVFETNSKIDEVIVFGSRAKGNYKEGSDIDLAVKGRNINFKDILNLSGRLDDLNLPYKIDLLDYAAINDKDVVEHMDRVGIVFYERWKEYKLSELCNLIGGGTPKTTVPEYWGGDIPWLSVSDFNNGNKFVFDAEKKITKKGLKESSTKILKKGQIIISARGTVGVISMLGKDMAFNQSNYGIDANAGLTSNEFLYYLLKDNIENFISVAYGAVFDTITKDTFEHITISIPPFGEQEVIVKILATLDDKIDLLQRQNKTLEQLAETLFRQWFEEEADESWEVKSVSEIIDVRDGTHDSPKQAVTGNYLITSKHLKPEGIDFKNAYKISDSDFFEINKRSKVDENDILFSMIGTLGLIHVVNYEPNFAIKNIGLFKSSQKPWFLNFLYLLLKSKVGEKFIYESADGSTQEYITLGNLRNFEFSFPGEANIKEFDKRVCSIFQKVKENTNQIKTLTQLRDTLLPKLMGGQVRVDIKQKV